MNFLTDKKGNLSWLRVSILIAVLGTLFFGGGILAFFLDQSSRNSPLMIDIPPGAQKWGSEVVLGTNWKRVYYRIPGDNLEAVADFYKAKMNAFYNNVAGEENGDVCQRLPPAGYYTKDRNDPNGIYDANFVEGESLPVVWKCLFDRSGLNNAQTTEVWIFTGQANPDPNLDAKGYVVIRHEQRWQS